MRSLQRQLRRNMLLTLLLALAGLLVLVNAGVQQIIHDYVLSRLQHDAESIMVALQQDTDGQWQLDTARVSATYSRVQSGHYYRVVSDTTDLRSRSLWDYEFAMPQLESGATWNQYQDGLGDEYWLVWSQAIRKHDRLLTVWVAEDISALQQTSLRYGVWAALVLLATVLLLVLAQQWILKRGFRQLDQVRDAIRGLRTGDRSGMPQQVPLEVQPLVAEIERLLERLQQRVSRSRNALGNLAHEMKRPLQRLRLLTEALPPDSASELNRLLHDITRMVERELKRARIVGVSSPGRQTVVREELPGLLEVLKKIYPACTINAEYADALVLPQDRDDMLELLGNLLDNACKFGARTVCVTLEQDSAGWLLRVDDDGPGIPAPALQGIVQRGVRLDETVAGAGLGLAICADIVASYQGSIRFENRSEGGLRVTVRLPPGE